MTGMSYDEAAAHVLRTVPEFTVGHENIGGVAYKVFTKIPATLPQLLKDGRSKQSDGAAKYLFYQNEDWTYDGFCDEVCALAQAMMKSGIGKGSRVAIAMRNYPEYLVLFMAITATGASVVFLNAWWSVDELDFAMSDSQPDMVFADGERMERLLQLKSEHRPVLIGVRNAEHLVDTRYSGMRDENAGANWPSVAVDTDDDFGIMYSSGTTGHPKGVILTHRGAVTTVFTWLMQAAMTPLILGDQAVSNPPRQVALVATPLFHVTASHAVFLYSLAAGTAVILMHKWDAETAVHLVKDHRVTRFIGVPTQSADLMHAAKKMGEPLETLTYISGGGAKRPAPQVGQLAKIFPGAMVATAWGMTETNAIGIGTGGADYTSRPGVAGRLYPPLQELRFLDESGADVAPGAVGELTVKSPSNMRCYLNNPEATAEILQDGWLRTGDLGKIDEDGFITILDRRKNIIIRGGENIACLDVEAALHLHPSVIDACAFSVPDERLGETVGAVVQLEEDQSLAADELCAFLGPHIAHFKIPEHVWFQTGPLPRGATDKIDRRGLRENCLKSFEKAPENNV